MKRLGMTAIVLFVVMTFSGALYAQSPGDPEEEGQFVDEFNYASIGGLYNLLWRGVDIINGGAASVALNTQITKGLVFGIDSYIDVSTINMSWAEYKFRYIQHLAKSSMAVQFGIIYYSRGGDVTKYPDTQELYAKIEDTGALHFSGTFYFDVNRGMGGYLELAAKKEISPNKNITFGPGGILGINIANQLLNSNNKFINLNNIDAFGFAEFKLSKNALIAFKAGISLPLYLNSSKSVTAIDNMVVYTTTTTPYVRIAYTYLFLK